MSKIISKPQPGEFAPYTTMYIDLVPNDGRLFDHLQSSLLDTLELARSFPEETLTYRFAPDEWTIKEILVHVIDDERIFCYRALRFGRNDSTELPGFDQDDYVPESRANERDLEGILAELAAVRQGTITLFDSFSPEALLCQGVGSGHPLSVRAAAYHITGHALHHLDSIRENFS